MKIHELNCVFLNVLLANQGRHRCQKQFRGSVFDGSSATDPDDPISRLCTLPGTALRFQRRKIDHPNQHPGFWVVLLGRKITHLRMSTNKSWIGWRTFRNWFGFLATAQLEPTISHAKWHTQVLCTSWNHHLLAYVYNMHFASVDAGRKWCEVDAQWWCSEPDALGLPARLLHHTLQCCRHVIDADIEGKLCRFHVYTWQSSVQPCMASAVVQFRLLVGLDFQRKVQNTNWIHKDPEKAQKQNKKWSNPKNKEKK